MTDVRYPMRFVILQLLADGRPRNCSQIALELGQHRGRVRQAVNNAHQAGLLIGDKLPTSHRRERMFTLPKFAALLHVAPRFDPSMGGASSVFDYAQRAADSPEKTPPSFGEAS